MNLVRRLAGSPSTVTARRVWCLWLVTRLVLATLCFTYHAMPGDLHYYYDAGRQRSLTHGMPEYPFVIAVGLMLPARVLPFLAYAVAYGASVLIADAVVTRTIRRRAGNAAAWWWVVLIALHGPLTLVRFDVWVAVALVVSLLVAVRAPALSGMAVAAAAAVKLWPAVFGVGLLGPARRRLTHTLAALVGGLAWAAVTVIVAGSDRLFSPLTWQGKRGFEIESLGGSLIGLERVFGSGVVHLMKRQGSWEYTGATADAWMGVVKPLQYGGYAAVLLLLALGTWAGRDARRSTAALTMTAVIGVFIATSPVISPQYLLWLVPGLVFVDDARLRRLGAVALGLSALEFPVMFDGIFSHTYAYEVATRLVIVARNVVLVWLVVAAIRLLVGRVRAA